RDGKDWKNMKSAKWWMGLWGVAGALALSVTGARGEATVRVTFDAHNGVQLWEGGPFWAETNIGAEEPWEYGLYFWWGDTVGYKRENGAWVASDGSAENFSFDSRNTPTCGNFDWITAEGTRAPEHDAAQVQWGGGWRMPTLEEFSALSNNCNWTWTAMNGVNGDVVRGRGDYANNSIFLPAAGYGDRTSRYDAGSDGRVWASVPSGSDMFAARLGFGGSVGLGRSYRYYGFPVRPVRAVWAENPKTETASTPVAVPYAWLDEKAASFVAANGGDYEAAAKAKAANGREMWECYVAGLSTTNAAEEFTTEITFSNGVPKVSWEPDLNEGGKKNEREYVVEGKPGMLEEWGATNSESRFFRVKVGMP
ncbi:MAG: hypothetical protein J6Y19_08665, partial [Kiritimatiellae bacterium]|nr:hypothetical protein [Kiritimatiellia bacterium]